MPRLGLLSSLTGGAPSSAPPTSSYYLDFDGSDQYTQTAGSLPESIKAASERSFSLWVKFDGAPSAAQTLLDYGSWVNGKDVEILINEDFLLLNVVGQDHSVTPTWAGDTWTHIGVVMTTVSGSTMAVQFWVDGSKEGSISGDLTSINTASTAITFGRRKVGSGSLYYDGGMDLVAIFGKALSDAEMASLYGSGTPATAGDASDISDLVGYWKFETGSGSTAYDSSDEGNDATLYNTPTWASH